MPLRPCLCVRGIEQYDRDCRRYCTGSGVGTPPGDRLPSGRTAPRARGFRPHTLAVALTLTAATALGLLLGFAPQLILSIAGGQPRQSRTCSPKPVRPTGSSPSVRCSEGIS